MVDVNTLTPEDISLMKEAIAAYEMNPQDNQAEEDDKFKKLADAIEILAERVQAMDERYDKLECVVMDDIIGGVKGIYDAERRGASISKLKESYGSEIEPLLPAYHAIIGKDDDDIYERLEDVLEELKGQDGYTDEMGHESIMNIINEIKSRAEKIKGPAPAAAIEVEVAKEPTEEENTIARIRKMKEKAGEVKF